MKLGTSKKRTRDRDKVQEGANIAGKKIPSTKSHKQDQQKLSLDTMISKTQCSKKVKKVPTCLSMLIEDFIQQSKEMATTKSLNGEKNPT